MLSIWLALLLLSHCSAATAPLTVFSWATHSPPATSHAKLGRLLTGVAPRSQPTCCGTARTYRYVTMSPCLPACLCFCHPPHATPFKRSATGAILHWLHYLPHYKTLPEPPAEDRGEALLRRRDNMKESALQIASYATKPDRKVGMRMPVNCVSCSARLLRRTKRAACKVAWHPWRNIVATTGYLVVVICCVSDATGSHSDGRHGLCALLHS